MLQLKLDRNNKLRGDCAETVDDADCLWKLSEKMEIIHHRFLFFSCRALTFTFPELHVIPIAAKDMQFARKLERQLFLRS
ncbi:MAG: hypothetical protein DMG91_01155 [Acidobacteria bacterium]|nr:MAG: hypothetical protein DMG91_01155 [Acidobacteriota bacterium]